MKKFFIILAFISFLNFDCNSVPPVMDSICSITMDICYYAKAICELYPDSSQTSFQNSVNVSDLKIYRNKLTNFYDRYKSKESCLTPAELLDIQLELTSIRDKLKETFYSMKSK